MTEEIQRLNDTVKSLEYKMSVLQKVNNLVAFSGNVEKVLEKILDLILEFIKVDFGIIYLVRLDQNTLKFSVIRSRNSDVLSQKDIEQLKTIRLYPGQGIAGHTVTVKYYVSGGAIHGNGQVGPFIGRHRKRTGHNSGPGRIVHQSPGGRVQ